MKYGRLLGLSLVAGMLLAGHAAAQSATPSPSENSPPAYQSAPSSTETDPFASSLPALVVPGLTVLLGIVISIVLVTSRAANQRRQMQVQAPRVQPTPTPQPPQNYVPPQTQPWPQAPTATQSGPLNPPSGPLNTPSGPLNPPAFASSPRPCPSCHRPVPASAAACPFCGQATTGVGAPPV